MAILIDENTRIVIQGMTGREGRLRAGMMLDAGAVISAPRWLACPAGAVAIFGRSPDP